MAETPRAGVTAGTGRHVPTPPSGGLRDWGARAQRRPSPLLVMLDQNIVTMTQYHIICVARCVIDGLGPEALRRPPPQCPILYHDMTVRPRALLASWDL